ncbi:hypothetical protein [Bacillus sp. FJAT-42376]|uniref:hypothetical protein n=1 Tax=Bacillus sp. FJAT-42376 TaxID=2014076 RepID=UPI001F1567C2|nr:hypothetical protein [Bacillus sp. FJAT-42376]
MVWRRFIVFALVIGFLAGIFSVKSDHIPYLGEGADISAFEIIMSYLAVMINSLPMWFIAAMTAGYWFGRNVREGILLGAVYTVMAITFYFVIGSLYGHSLIQLSFKEQIGVYALWYGASLAGGCIGGAAGYLFKKTPYVLFILLFGLLVQLVINGAGSWNNIVGAAQNITFCLMSVYIVYFLLAASKKKAAG